MANRCPNRTNERYSTERHSTERFPTEQVNYTLITVKEEMLQEERTQHTMMNTTENVDQLNSLVKDTLGMALLDSGCTKTVVGAEWLSVYMSMLDEKDKEKVTHNDDYSTFRFGDGAKVVSTQVVKIPAVIGSKEIMIKTNVVNNDIPLLLSRDSMKKGNMIMNFKTDKAVILGEEIPLHSTKCGHYCIPLIPRVSCQLSFETMKNFVLHISEEFKRMPRKERKTEGTSTICPSD